MAEANTAEVEATVEAAFLGTGPDVTLPPPGATVVKEPVIEEPPKPEDVVVVPVVVPAKPQYVRLTKEELDLLKTRAGKVDGLESRVAKFEGSMPKAEQIVQQVIDAVKAQTPAGTEIDPQVLADAFADQEKDFPELAGQNRKAIEHILKHLRGTIGTAASPAPPVDVNAAIEKVLLNREVAALAKAYPDWSDIVGRPLPGTTEVRDTDFRKWFAKQPAEYQQEIGTTKSPAEIQAAIKLFKSSAAAPPSPTPTARAAARRAVIEDAVTPRGDGSTPPLNAPMSADDAFASGFKAVKRS